MRKRSGRLAATSPWFFHTNGQMAWVIKFVISQYQGKPLWDKMAAVFKGTKIINIPHTMERRLGNDCDSLGPLTT